MLTTQRTDTFPTELWEDETDWLVSVISLPKDDPFEDTDETLAYAGRLAAYALVTNARCLAQLGDVELPGYEIWFSFDSAVHKKQFLELVTEVEGDPEELFIIPDEKTLKEELKNLRPYGMVFPQREIAVMTSHSLGLMGTGPV